MDLEAWLSEDITSEETKKAYQYFMKPEPRDVLSDVLVEEGTGLRYRMMAIGMVRNAKEKKALKVFLDPMPHIRLEKGKPLQGWYKGKNERDGVRERPCFTEAILTEPYGGFCAVGCAFCYINAGFRGYRGTGLISVPMGYGGQVRKALSTMRTSAAGYFSSFTDPFLPLESVYHNTQEGASAFVDAGLPIFFLSRLPYPGWAFDLLSKSPYSYAQKSINTPHQADWKRLSPGAATLEHHLEEIRELRARGIYVSIQCNPIVPGVVSHDDVELLFEKLAEAGANHVIVKFVEAGYSWAPAMIERMQYRFGARGDAFAALFTENLGGQKQVQEAYRMEGHVRYKRKATALGMTYATCYEYAFDRDVSGKIVGRVGHSIGRDFLTADQCHGHRVPMFTRKASLSDPFTEVEECPPTGCLSCSDENAGKPRCGSEVFGDAPALRQEHLRTGVYDPPKPPEALEADGKRRLKVVR